MKISVTKSKQNILFYTTSIKHINHQYPRVGKYLGPLALTEITAWTCKYVFFFTTDNIHHICKSSIGKAKMLNAQN